MPSTTRAVSRATVVLDSIRAEILRGDLPPGTPLRVQALAERYDVSMAVLREALARLVEHNLATLAPNQGFRVVEISRSDLIDLTELRIDLEGKALVKSIELGDVHWEARVVSAHYVLDRAVYLRTDGPGATDEWIMAHTAFHNALIDACGRRRLLELTRSLRNSAELYRQLSGINSPDHRDPRAEHRTLMELATARRAEEARDELVRHIQKTTDAVLANALIDD